MKKSRIPGVRDWVNREVPTWRAVGFGALAGALGVFLVRGSHAVEDHGWSRLLEPTLWTRIAPFAGIGAAIAASAAPVIEGFHLSKSMVFQGVRIIALFFIVGLALLFELMFDAIVG